MVFGSVENLEIESLEDLTKLIRFFNKVSQERQIYMFQTVKSITIQTCRIAPEEQDTAYIEMRDFILQF